jgi:hypothetical protein
MPVDEEWLARLRKQLGIVPSWEPPAPVPKPRPVEMELPLAKESTSSIAGSWERIEVYRQRVERGEQIFHELDCKLIAVRSSKSHVG